MTSKEKTGLVVVIVLFAMFGVLLVLTMRPAGNATGGAEDSVLVQQRIRNLQEN